VEWWRLLAGLEQSVSLKVPVTVMSKSSGVVLIRNNTQGKVVFRAFPTLESALSVLKVPTIKASESFSPQYSHKITGNRIAFYRNSAEAGAAWEAAGQSPQFLQLFIQTPTKTPSFLRVHWKNTLKTATFYIVSSRIGGKKQGTVAENYPPSTDPLLKPASSPILGSPGPAIA
jgi:hypothetical protein